jgi:hypothetical protein
MSYITQFRGILAPDRSVALGHSGASPPSQAMPAGLILHALGPLRGELDAALARDDRPAALRLSYDALSRVADALADYRGDKLSPGQVRVHALLVELEALPLEPMADGTLTEGGTAVSVSYRNWALDRAAAGAWAQMLTERFYALWPGAWVVVPSAADAEL